MRGGGERAGLVLAAALALAGAGSSARGASPDAASADERLAAVDRTLARVDAVLDTVSAIQEGRCAERLTGQDIVEAFGPSRMMAPNAGGVLVLHVYFACLAARSNEPKVCDALSTLPEGDLSAARLCRRVSFELMLARSLVKPGSQTGALCQELDAANLEEDKLFKPGRAVGACKAWSSYAGDPVALCQETADAVVSVEGCAWVLRQLSGDPAVCAGIADPLDRELCSDFGAIARAEKAGSPEACGRSAVCLALMGGERGSCSAYSRRTAEALCAEPGFRRWYVQGRLSAADALEGEARQVLLELAREAEIVDVSGPLAVDWRLERLARQRLRRLVLKGK